MMKFNLGTILSAFLILLFSSVYAGNFQDKEQIIREYRERIAKDGSFQRNQVAYKRELQKSFAKAFITNKSNDLEDNLRHYFDSLELEKEKRFEKFLEERTKVTIKALNKRIDKNNKLLKAGKTTEVDYIVDLRRYYTGTSNEFISKAKEDQLNVELREIHQITGKAVYVVLSPIFPEQLSYAARTSPDYAKTDYRYSYYPNQFNENARKAFMERHSRYVAWRSHLSNKGNSGAVLNIESLMHYDPNHVFGGKKGAWVIKFYDFLAFSKNINPESAALIAKDIKDEKKRKGVVFSNSFSVMESSLTAYIDAISWNWIAAFNGGILTKTMGKYRIQLDQLSEDDKAELLLKIKTPTPSGYIASKDNLTDHANVEDFLKRTLDFYLSRSANTSGIKLKIITTSDVNMPGGKNAMQLAQESNPPGRTIVIGYHFSEAAGKIWLHWCDKYSADLAIILPPGIMDTLWKEVGTRTASDYFTLGGYLLKDHVLIPLKEIASNAWDYAKEKAMLFGDMIVAIYDNKGRIPERWYKEGWMSSPGWPIVAGVYNGLLDDIIGLYDLGKLVLVDVPLAVIDGINSLAKILYDYATNEEYRNAINTSLQNLANSTFEMTRGIVQSLAFEMGYQFNIIGNITEEEYQQESVIQKFATNLKTVDWYKLDRDVSAAMSVPFVYIGKELEKCYGYGSTAQDKQYCSGYIAVSVVLLFTGIEELAIVSKAAKAADIAKVLTKTKFKEYIDKLVGFTKKGYKAVDEALANLLKRMPPWAKELVAGAQNMGAKVIANGEEVWVYCNNKIDVLCKIGPNGVRYVRNWIDELEIKITYPRFGIEEVAMVTPDGSTRVGVFQMVQKENGEFYIKRPKASAIINTIDQLVDLVEDSYKTLLRRDLNESDELFNFLRNSPDKLDAWKILSNSIHSTNITAINYVDMLKNGTHLGRAPTNDYIKIWRENFPSLQGGNFNVHHSIEQQVLRKWPNLFDEAEINSFQNLRGISGEINSDVHLSRIRKEWDKFYDEFPDGVYPTKQQVLDWAKHVDDMFGHYFSPPIRRQ